MKSPTNSTVAKGIGTSEQSDANWAAFDRLPRALRRLLWGAPVGINPQSVEDIVRDHGAAEASVATRQAIGEELHRFDAQHSAAHGYKLPGVAAEVAPLRYGDHATATAPKPGRRLILRKRRT